MKFKSKPKIIDAIKCEEAMRYANDSWHMLPTWIKSAYEKGEILFLTHPARVHLETLNGWLVVHTDEWIIRGIKGELYPCAPDIFEATYEEI